MATIQQRGNSYFITVSCGLDVRGKQVRQTKTWRIPENMTAKQAEKEAQRQAFMFEESVKRGQINKAVKFEEFALEWFKEVGALKLKQRTLANYRNYSKRVFKAIGHQRMDRLTSRDVQKLIAEMNEGARLDKYKKGKLETLTRQFFFSGKSGEIPLYYYIRLSEGSQENFKNGVFPIDKAAKPRYT